jgi:DNA ligase (NAD+)
MESIIKKLAKYSDNELEKYFNTEKLPKLHEIKLYLDDIYYNTGKDSGFTDFQYDLLKEILQKRDPNYVPPVGAKIRAGENKVKLPYWLGSMNKLKPEDINELNRWIIKNEASECIIEDKLDGISCLLIIDNNKIKLYTRGDGEIGSDISYFAPYFKNIPKNIKENIAIRGELIMKYDIFKEKYSAEFANPRNFVAGRIGSKTLRKGIEDIDFIAYEIVKDGICMKPEDQLNKLKELGFDTVNYSLTSNIIPEELVGKFLLSKQNSQYEIDGIIVQSNTPYVRNTSGNPSYAFAFKVRLDKNIVEATVEEVEWNVSKWGVLKPRIRITPINLNGVKITYTTGFNAKYIVDNNIGPDTIIQITRSGDVIPYIVSVIESTYAQLPEDIEYEWNETKVDIISKDNNNIMCVKLIASFFSALKIKYVSEATIEKMFNHGLKNIIDIVSAKQEDFEEIEGFGKRLAERTYENIHNGLKNISISLLLGASGVFGLNIGTKKVELLFNAFPNILDIYKDYSYEELYNEIINIEGFSDKTTTQIIDNLEWAEKFIKNMDKYITLKDEKPISDDLLNYKIVFSGFRDKTLEEKIKKRGGKVVTSVSKNTTLLVVADIYETSAKIKKAKELGIDIYEKEEFIKRFNI